MMCSACQQFIDSMMTREEKRPTSHHKTCRSLECAVKAVYYVCNRLWVILPHDARNWIRGEASNSPIASHSVGVETGSDPGIDHQRWILSPMSITHALRAYEKPGYEGEEFFRIFANPQAFPLWTFPDYGGITRKHLSDAFPASVYRKPDGNAISL
ncbi:uncharacterized protein CCOS01_01746 [Colletotrichum costaricense]|uniref:Uncharacterized protein n=1 Tax=Colletotrichum costaricense TaxID=1209916 RepID=A0AAJ0E6E8_9PEZI|nr:uncharacterized protein CCOS01_01746 [Colletotrichum costaricense]KAK1536426.1 hypothetical protein CCOS01_01746 [Colletotrichum costaricense]